jgi:hypothetical protein
MNTSRSLIAVFVTPSLSGHENVVSRVHWQLRFDENGIHSDAFVETFLDTSSLNDFVPANEIGNERLLQWAYDAQGGDLFVAQIQPHHEEVIAHQVACAGQVPYSQGFDLVTIPLSHNPIPTTTL